MNPGPSPLLQDWIQIPGFLWLVLCCIAAAVLVILTYYLVQAMRDRDLEGRQAEWDNEHQDDIDRYHCAAFGCSWHLAEGDRVYVCGVCGARVIRDADLYDQERGVA